MFSVLLVVLCFLCRVAVVAQSSLSIVCVAGQCFQGISNTTIGATLSGPGGTPRLQLLPGQYTSTTNPQLLHNLLTSPSSTLVGSAGFRSASLSALPLNLQLEPGVAVYSQSLYSGQALFAKLPESPVSNTSIPLSANSIAIAPNVWIAVSNNNNRLILWDSVPDTSQLPSRGSLSLLDIQSSTCSPPCSGSSICSTSGTCTCPTGFSGSACESCADGFFGPTCAPCPAGCPNCDQGMSGTGRCLTPIKDIDSLPSKCNCLNGVCGTGGQCTCNSGWTAGNNGTACAKCAPGFFLSKTGDCQVCQLGCVQCTDGTGDCITCKAGFTQDANDKTKCTRIPNRTANTPCLVDTACVSAVPCPDGSFPSGGQCSQCSPSCLTCTGPTSNDCTLCASGTYFFNGNCVSTDSNGVCQGTNGMIANNIKFTCDSCGAKCTSCRIPNFSTASTMDLLECTGCLPGFFLFEGNCIAGCSTGTFASSQDNTCSSCSSSCSTCAGSPDFCLTCPSGRLASSGKCVSSCPSDTFSSSGSCIKCHPDCATCSGASFNQCNSCPPSRPVRVNGRCLSTCSRTQYFDSSTLTCQACDSSCSSCSGPGSSNCQACSSSSQVLRGGSCVSMNCQGSSGIIPGLGVCLSELVQVSSSSGSAAPIPSGLTEPTKTSPNLKLTWWQIFLMTLGCAFILLVLLWFWRRRARKHREKKTQTFAREKNLDGVHGWLVRLGKRLFRNKRNPQSNLPMTYAHDSPLSPKIQPIERDILLKKLAPPRSEGKARSEKGKARSEKRDSMDDFLDAYEHSIDSRTSYVSSVNSRRQSDIPRRFKGRIDRNLYSEVTGRQRSTPDPRESLYRDPVTARDSIGSSVFVPSLPKKYPMNREGVPVYHTGYQPQLDRQISSTSNRFNLTDAQAYMQSVRPMVSGETGVSSRSQATPSSFPIPTYTTAPTFPRQIGPMFSVPQVNHIPIHGSLSGNGQGPYSVPLAPPLPNFMSSGPNVMSQPMQTGESYVTVSSRNPFRNR